MPSDEIRKEKLKLALYVAGFCLCGALTMMLVPMYLATAALAVALSFNTLHTQRYIWLPVLLFLAVVNWIFSFILPVENTVIANFASCATVALFYAVSIQRADLERNRDEKPQTTQNKGNGKKKSRHKRKNNTKSTAIATTTELTPHIPEQHPADYHSSWKHYRQRFRQHGQGLYEYDPETGEWKDL